MSDDLHRLAERWRDLFAMLDRAQAGIPGASEQALVAVRFIAQDIQAALASPGTGAARTAEPAVESRSVQRRKAIMRGEPRPEFGAPDAPKETT